MEGNDGDGDDARDMDEETELDFHAAPGAPADLAGHIMTALDRGGFGRGRGRGGRGFRMAVPPIPGAADPVRRRRGRFDASEENKQDGVFPYIQAAAESGRPDSVDLVEYLLTEGADVTVEMLSSRAKSVVIRALKQREEREEVANFCSTAFATGVFYYIKFPTDVVRIIVAYAIGSEGRQAGRYRLQMSSILSRAPSQQKMGPGVHNGVQGTWQEDGQDENGAPLVTFVPASSNSSITSTRQLEENKDEENRERETERVRQIQVHIFGTHLNSKRRGR